jgi:hypothetical protein
MNFDDIVKTWQSPHNRPNQAEMEKHKMNMISDLRKRRRSSLGLLLISLLPLLFVTGKLALHLIAPDPSLDKVDLSREWAVVPMFLLPWGTWLILARIQHTHHVKHPDYDRSIQSSVAALLDENRTERLRYRIVTTSLIASVPALAVVVYQLRSVGKVGNEVFIPAFVIYPLYVVGVVLWCAYYHRTKMLPRKRELETLMTEYTHPAP